MRTFKNAVFTAAIFVFCFLALVGQSLAQNESSEPSKLKILKNPQVSIDDSIIRKVGETEPRLALALINIRKLNVEFTWAQVNFSSMDYTFDDVEKHLTEPLDSEYYDQVKKGAAQSLARDGIVIRYDVSLKENPGTGTLSLNVSLVSGAGKSLELILQRTVFGSGKNQSEGFKATSYQFK